MASALPAQGPRPLLDDSVRGRVLLGVIHAVPVRIAESGEALRSELDALAAGRRAEFAGRQPSDIPALAPARLLYRTFGVDPTRTRPSSEAFLRRILQGKGLPLILNAVDVCTLCSVRFLLPIGLYDAAALRGQVVLRCGGAGESYAGIRKDEVHLEGRLLLADDRGPFGNPTSDSLRTSVGQATEALLMVVFAPAGYPREAMREHAEFAASALARHLAGSSEVATAAEILP